MFVDKFMLYIGKSVAMLIRHVVKTTRVLRTECLLFSRRHGAKENAKIRNLPGNRTTENGDGILVPHYYGDNPPARNFTVSVPESLYPEIGGLQLSSRQNIAMREQIELDMGIAMAFMSLFLFASLTYVLRGLLVSFGLRRKPIDDISQRKINLIPISEKEKLTSSLECFSSISNTYKWFLNKNRRGEDDFDDDARLQKKCSNSKSGSLRMSLVRFSQENASADTNINIDSLHYSEKIFAESLFLPPGSIAFLQVENYALQDAWDDLHYNYQSVKSTSERLLHRDPRSIEELPNICPEDPEVLNRSYGANVRELDANQLTCSLPSNYTFMSEGTTENDELNHNQSISLSSQGNILELEEESGSRFTIVDTDRTNTSDYTTAPQNTLNIISDDSFFEDDESDIIAYLEKKSANRCSRENMIMQEILVISQYEDEEIRHLIDFEIADLLKNVLNPEISRALLEKLRCVLSIEYDGQSDGILNTLEYYRNSIEAHLNELVVLVHSELYEELVKLLRDYVSFGNKNQMRGETFALCLRTLFVALEECEHQQRLIAESVCIVICSIDFKLLRETFFPFFREKFNQPKMNARNRSTLLMSLKFYLLLNKDEIYMELSFNPVQNKSESIAFQILTLLKEAFEKTVPLTEPKESTLGNDLIRELLNTYEVIDTLFLNDPRVPSSIQYELLELLIMDMFHKVKRIDKNERLKEPCLKHLAASNV